MKVSIIFASAAIVAMALPVRAQFKFTQVPYEVPRESGQSVTPAYEGWWQNPDGTYNLLFGYFNRNSKEALDIPVGPNNHIDPGPADQGQPTHFVPRRQKGVFTVTVPKDFGTKKLTWTLTANGQTLSVPGHLGAAWIISPLAEVGIGNTPPTISFDEKGPSVQGPKPMVVARSARAGEPMNLNVFAADDDRSIGITVMRLGLEVAAKATGAPMPPAAALTTGTATDAVPTPELLAAAAAAGFGPDTIARFQGGPGVMVTWQKYRGSGDVIFGEVQPKVEATPGSGIPIQNVFNGKASTTVTFSQAGEYVLRVTANDSSGPDGGDFVCCWTNGEVKVTVK